jgi:hypothetical protein
MLKRRLHNSVLGDPVYLGPMPRLPYNQATHISEESKSDLKQTLADWKWITLTIGIAISN